MKSNNKPKCIAVTGVNGSGKSTLFSSEIEGNIQFINPDVIARNIAPDNFNDPVVSIKAGREAIKQTRSALDNKQSFSFESTLSGEREIKVLKEAKSKGFSVELNYVGVKDVSVSISRVAHRVSQGGHDIPMDALLRRYEKSINNLPRAMLIADDIKIYDNTKSERALIYKKNGEKVVNKSEQLPKWADAAIKKYEIVKWFRDKGDRIGDKALQKIEEHVLKADRGRTLDWHRKLTSRNNETKKNNENDLER